MKVVFFLGPGYFKDSSKAEALEGRRRLAGLLPDLHVLIMEDEKGAHGEDDLEKFQRLCQEADKYLVWLPRNGRLPTVFSELVLLRHDAQKKEIEITVLHENGVLDTAGGEFHVLVEDGQIAYLRDLPRASRLRCFEYTRKTDLDRLVRAYGAGLLENAT